MREHEQVVGAGRAPLVAVSPEQHHLLRTAETFRNDRQRWPTSYELAAFADRMPVEVWRDLRILERLGCVRWMKTVAVVRRPDGFFLALNTERSLLAEVRQADETPREFGDTGDALSRAVRT
jgi:predicted transcriptional regulator